MLCVRMTESSMSRVMCGYRVTTGVTGQLLRGQSRVGTPGRLPALLCVRISRSIWTGGCGLRNVQRPRHVARHNKDVPYRLLCLRFAQLAQPHQGRLDERVRFDLHRGECWLLVLSVAFNLE